VLIDVVPHDEQKIGKTLNSLANGFEYLYDGSSFNMFTAL